MMDSLTAFRNIEPGDAPRVNQGYRLSQAIGWAGAGVGLAELALPRRVGKLLGLAPRRRTDVVLRAIGLGNLVSGLGILGRPRRAAPMWLRVGNDLASLGLLAWVSRTGRDQRSGRVTVALLASCAAVALDTYASRSVTRAQERSAPQPIFSVTINRPAAEVYAFFRKFENLPCFMDYLERVEPRLQGRSHWVARSAGMTIEWDAEITADIPGERIEWRTIENSPFAHRGSVTFANTPGGGATEVRVEMEVGLPGMAPSSVLARVLTKAQIKGDLRRLKQVLETGEVLFSDASLHTDHHPSQPSPEGARRAQARAAESGKVVNINSARGVS